MILMLMHAFYNFVNKITTAIGSRSACHSPGVYPSPGGFLPPSYHPHQHHPSQYHPHRGGSPHHSGHGGHNMPPTMGPPHHHHHHQAQSLQHLHYRQPPTCKYKINTNYQEFDKFNRTNKKIEKFIAIIIRYSFIFFFQWQKPKFKKKIMK